MPLSSHFDALEAILAATRRRVSDARAREPLARLERRALAREPRGEAFRVAIGEGPAPRIIAECKRRSPSRGILRADYDPVAVAGSYVDGGAVAISVLTEPAFFDGALEHLSRVREAVSVPLLRKDFIIDEYQVLEARAAGADAVLLIAAALTGEALNRLAAEAAAHGLAALVEVHDHADLDAALRAGASILGVNSRNLRTLTVDLDRMADLVAAVPDGCLVVAESGLRSGDDLRRLSALGADAFLIGERLVGARSPGAALAALIADARGGITAPEVRP